DRIALICQSGRENEVGTCFRGELEALVNGVMARDVEVGLEKPRCRCGVVLRDVEAGDRGRRPVSVAENASIEADRTGDPLQTLVRSRFLGTLQISVGALHTEVGGGIESDPTGVRIGHPQIEPVAVLVWLATVEP